MYKYIIENKKAALFDLDGTIADTEIAWRTAFLEVFLREGGTEVGAKEFLLKRGVPSNVKWQQVLNSSLLVTQKTPEQLSNEETEVFLEILKNTDIDTNEGFWNLVNKLKNDKGFKLGLTTNQKKETGEKILQKLGIEKTFDVITFGNEVVKQKPNPDIYQITAKKLGIMPKDILVFEDSPTGAEAAINAGMSLVVVWDGAIPQEEYPEETLLFIENFAEIIYNLDHNFVEAFKDFQNRVLNKKNNADTN